MIISNFLIPTLRGVFSENLLNKSNLLILKNATFLNVVKFFLLGGAVGWLAWGSGDSLYQLAWISVIPLAWGRAVSKWSATALIAGYFLSGSRGIVDGAKVFFGQSNEFVGLSFWTVSSLLLTLPFFFAWSADRRKNPHRFLAALVVIAVPPLGIFGWGNPFVAAGVFFPGLSWLGLILMSGMLMSLVSKNKWWIYVFFTMAISCNLISHFISSESNNFSKWGGVDTGFPGVASGVSTDGGLYLSAFRRLQWIKNYANEVAPGRVVVFPETVIGAYDISAEYELNDAEKNLRTKGSRLIVGGELPQSDGRYKNSLVVLGAEKEENKLIVQSIPVPFSMWKPWSENDGAVANLSGKSAILVKGVRTSGIICYEQFLFYSWIMTMVDKPEIVLAASNLWWARDTSLPNIQLQMIRSFRRLFDVQVIVSRNL